MKKLRKLLGVILLICALVVMQLPASEADAATTSASDFTVSGDGTLTKYNGSSANVVIPDTVLTIATDAFKNNTVISSVTIPKTVTKIEPYAFWGSSLQSVTLGSGLTEIGDYAFANCKFLTSVDVPENITSVGIYAFEDDINLTDATFTYKTMSIHESAFDGCYKLVIHAPEGSYPYKYAQDFIKRQAEFNEYEDVPSYNPDGTTVIDVTGNTSEGTEGDSSENADEDSSEDESSIEFIYNPDGTVSSKTDYSSILNNDEDTLASVHVVGNTAFFFMDSGSAGVYSSDHPYVSTEDSETESDSAEEESSQTEIDDKIYGSTLSKYTVVDGKIVADQAYYCNNSLDKVTLPKTITEIGQFAFARSSVSSVDVPDGTQTIDYGAFYHCDSLKSVTLPESIIKVEPKAFSESAWVNNFLSGESGDSDFLISGGVLVAYRGNSSVVNIPDGVRVIAAQVFENHSEISEVELPQSVKYIGEEAFFGCSGLSSVNLQDTGSVSILDRAFYGTALTAVTLPETAQNLGINAFDENTDISYLGNTVTKITHENTAERLSNESFRDSAYVNNATVVSSSENKANGVTVTGEEGIIANLEAADRPYTLNITRISKDDTLTTAMQRAEDFISGRSFIDGCIYDLELTDKSGIAITKLGKVGLTVAVPLPEEIGSSQKITVLTVDRNGQLEELIPEIVSVDDVMYVRFTTYHLSPFGIYGTGESLTEDDIIISDEVITALSAYPGNETNGENITVPKFLAKNKVGTLLYNWFYPRKWRAIPAAIMVFGGFFLIFYRRRFT